MKELIEKLEEIKVDYYFDLSTHAINTITEAIQALSQSEGELQKVKAVQDESFHWYIIPNKLLEEFELDQHNQYMIDCGKFDDKWRKYRTGGGLNIIQLYAKITPQTK